MISRRCRTAAVLIFCLLAFSIFPPAVSADMGPKDRLTVIVENPPEEAYYLDLLTENTRSYDNFHQTPRESYDQAMLALLYDRADEGWLPAFTEGTGVPMDGDLSGEQEGKTRVHVFGYVGLPKTYRIIIVTESGRVSVSESYTRRALQSAIRYDYASGQGTPSPWYLMYLVLFPLTLLATLLVEGLLLLAFRFPLRENGKVFLLTNIVTQALLTLTLALMMGFGTADNSLTARIPAEIAILLTEAAVYLRFLRGGGKMRRVLYAITANLVSWGFSFVLFFLNIMLGFGLWMWI